MVTSTTRKPSFLACRVCWLIEHYSQPVLLDIAGSLNISESRVSIIPTLRLIGFIAGLLLIGPLADKINRRQLVLALVVSCSGICFGLAVVKSAVAFEALSFFLGASSISHQILIPRESSPRVHGHLKENWYIE